MFKKCPTIVGHFIIYLVLMYKYIITIKSIIPDIRIRIPTNIDSVKIENNELVINIIPIITDAIILITNIHVGTILSLLYFIKYGTFIIAPAINKIP